MRRLNFYGFVAAILAVAPFAGAVVIGGYPDSADTSAYNTSPPASFTGWNYVGNVNGASCVYLGNGWFLTASHVGPSTVTLNGNTYAWDGGFYQLHDPNNPANTTDIDLFHTSQPVMLGTSTLPNLSIAYSSPAIGASYYNVGYGWARNTAIQYYDSSFQPATSGSYTYAGYGFGNSNTRSFGTNTVASLDGQNLAIVNAGYGDLIAFGSVFNPSLDPTSTIDQIVNGDSGGGAFDMNNVLIGMNDARDLYKNQPSNTALFGNSSYMGDIASYYDQIYADTGVPEPTLCAIGVIPGAALLLRRRVRLA